MKNNAKNIVFVGMKHAGKSTVSKLYAEKNKMNVIEVDALIKSNYAAIFKEELSVREIYVKLGEDLFRKYENTILTLVFSLGIENTVIDCGGGTLQNQENCNLIQGNCKVIWLKLDQKINLERIMENGIPSFFKYPDDPLKSFELLVKERFPIYNQIADMTVEYSTEIPEMLLDKINTKLLNK